MRLDGFFKFDSIVYGLSSAVVACISASIAWGQSDEHLISPIAVKAVSYFEIQDQESLGEIPTNFESTRRREIEQSLNKQASPQVHSFNFSDIAARPQRVQSNSVPRSGKSSRMTLASSAHQDKEQEETVESDENEVENKVPDASDDFAVPLKNSDSSFWVRKKIQDVRTNIRELELNAPVDRSSELDYGMTDWCLFTCAPKTFAWVAPDIRYQPLYFEDVALERYGQTLGFHRQTFRSGFHFFKSAITFPNKLRHDGKTCDYPLGFCRPGSCVSAIEQKHYLGCPR